MRALLAPPPIAAGWADEPPRGLAEAGQERWPEAGPPEADRESVAGDIVEQFPSRCPKPAVAPAVLTRLLAEAEARLALSFGPVGAALRDRWPEPPQPVPVLHPSPNLPAYAISRDHRHPTPNAVLALFGLDADGQRAAIERTLRERGGPVRFTPVFLTNDPDFGPLRAAHLAFEYYPFLLDEAAGPPPADWAAYVVDMLQLTMRRWGVRRIVRA